MSRLARVNKKRPDDRHMLDENAILAVVSAVLFLVSEILPFITKVDGNGLTHTILLVVRRLVDSSKDKQILT